MTAQFDTMRDGNGLDCQLLPPGLQKEFETSQALVNHDRSFLVPAVQCDGPLSTEKRPLAPLDSETGMPLLIAPSDLPQGKDPEVGFHHLHGRLWDVAVNMSNTERLLRRTYGQRVLRAFHNGTDPRAYHKFVHQVSVALLDDEMDLLGAMVLPHIGHVPPEVADTNSGELVVRPMTETERAILHKPRGASPPTEKEINDFHDKWLPQTTHAQATYVLSTYRGKWAQYSYRDIDNGNGQVRSHLTDFFLERELAHENSRQVRHLLEKNDKASDETLLDILVAAVCANVTVRGERIATLYPKLLQRNTLYDDMPNTLNPFMRFRLANPLGGIALSPERRNQLLGREEGTLVD